MFKSLIISTMLVLLLSCSGYADIGQTQGFNTGSDNLVLLSGNGSAFGGNNSVIGQSQVAINPACGNVIVLQGETGILNQGVTAVGSSGVLGAIQSLGALGQQLQLADLCPILQNQNLGILLHQELVKDDGAGGVVAGQGAVVGQVQIAATPYGISGSAQFTGIAQFDSIGGGPGSCSTISKDMAVGANQ